MEFSDKIRNSNPLDCAEIEIKYTNNFGASFRNHWINTTKKGTLKNGEEPSIFKKRPTCWATHLVKKYYFWVDANSDGYIRKLREENPPL